MELNHRKYLDRIDLYKRYGYDTIADRKFILEASMPLCGRILEVGTGKGHMALILARAGYDFVSVDISEEEQNIAKTNLEYYGVANKVDFKIANAENLNYPDYSFDAIISVDTVHHMNNPFQIMKEFIRVLDSNGKIILSDFTDEGFELLEKVHNSEGRSHNSSISNIRLRDIENYFQERLFFIDKKNSKFHQLCVISRCEC